MQTILHIGSPKTGTTALQHGLYAAREALLEEKVLYPFLSLAEKSKNHGPLSMMLLRQDRLPRIFRFMSDEERQAASVTAIQELAYQISKNIPERLVLSSEYFFRVIPPGNWDELLKLIPECDPRNVRICCYVRKPSAHYLSLLQQKIKASHEILPPTPHNFRRVLETYQEQFPHAQMSVRAFERRSLEGGDISRDFFATQLPKVSAATVDKAIGVETNISLSAPSMMILRDFRKKFHPYDNDKYMRDSNRIRKILEVADEVLEIPRPKMRDEIVDQVDYCGNDLVWLRDKHGASFAGYDYDRAGTFPEWDPERAIGSLRELLVVDDEVLERLIQRLRTRKFIREELRYAQWAEDLEGRRDSL